MDWRGWLELTRKGAVVRIPRRLVDHRVHEGSETSRCLWDGSRRSEDRMVLRELWPVPIADLIEWGYSHSYRGYL